MDPQASWTVVFPSIPCSLVPEDGSTFDNWFDGDTSCVGSNIRTRTRRPEFLSIYMSYATEAEARHAAEVFNFSAWLEDNGLLRDASVYPPKHAEVQVQINIFI